jgi:hypothetical protein
MNFELGLGLVAERDDALVVNSKSNIQNSTS